MNFKKITNDLAQKIKKYKLEHPSKYKYVIVICSSVAAITLTVVIVSTAPSLFKSNTSLDISPANSTQAQNSSERYAVQDTSSKSPNISRSEKSSLDPAKGDIIKLGVKDSIVIIIQKRLMELDYIELDEPSEEYGETLEFAVQLFQRKNELKTTGQIDAKTYELMMSDKAKKYTVSLGAKGTDVEQLQMRLYELGYLTNKTSYFGTETETAVKEFQKKNGLYDDGNVGKITREILYSAKAVPLSYYLGDENQEIKKYQNRLIELGYLTTEPDGKYGNDTVVAVKLFQEKNGVIADGFIGPATKDLLMSNDATENALILGTSGDGVTNVQKYLNKLGYLNTITGYFGSATNEAVLKFQKNNKLTVDGKIGFQTINQLLSPDAIKWKKPSSSSNSGKNSSKNGHSGGHSSKRNSSNGSSSGSSNSGSNYSNDDDDSGSISGPSVESFISIAESKLGSTYVYGSKGPNTFDCSGFVYWTLNKAGVRQSYMTSDTWQSNGKYQRISSMSNIRRGDVISFNGHVGIALGGGQMIDASSSRGRVRVTNINSSYWRSNFVSAFRVF